MVDAADGGLADLDASLPDPAAAPGAAAPAPGAAATPPDRSAPAPADDGDGREMAERADAQAPEPDTPDRTEPARERPDTERGQEPEPPQPEPEPPQPEPEPPDMQEFLRVDERTEADEAPDDARFIGGRDAEAEHRSRTRVTERVEGPRTPREVGQTSLPSRPSLEVHEGDPKDPIGMRPEVSDERAEPADDGGGSGRQAREVGAGATARGGDRTEGGPAARRSVDRPSSPRPSASEGDAQRPATASGGLDSEGFRAGPHPTRQSPSEAPRWWEPQAVRVVAAPPAPPPRPTRASPSDGDGVALVETPGRADDRGGTQADRADEQAPPTDPADDPREGSESAEEPGTTDPVADLRQSLGWGGIERTAVQPRASHTGARSAEGAQPSSPQTVVSDDDDDLGAIAWQDARETPLGRYTEQVYEVVQEHWHSHDLAQHEKAMGIQGEVSLMFRVHRNGAVSDLALLRSSGHTALDRLALQSVPDRLPRFPRELRRAQDSVVQKITFRYRNPLIVADGQ